MSESEKEIWGHCIAGFDVGEKGHESRDAGGWPLEAERCQTLGNRFFPNVHRGNEVLLTVIWTQWNLSDF